MDEAENEQQGVQEKESPEKKESSGLLLTVIRVIICVLCIAAAAVIRWIGGSIHAQIGTLFYDYYNNSIFMGEEQPPLPFNDETEIKETSLITENSLKTDNSAAEKSAENSKNEN